MKKNVFCGILLVLAAVIVIGSVTVLGPCVHEDGSEAPVLWQVLSVDSGKALLYTTYVIDAHQPMEVSGKKAENKQYPDISSYAVNEQTFRFLSTNENVYPYRKYLNDTDWKAWEQSETLFDSNE